MHPGPQITVVSLAALTVLAACSSSGGAPSAPYSSAGDQQCTITYTASGKSVGISITGTVAGTFSFNVAGTGTAADESGNLDAGGSQQFTENVTGFQRITGSLTASDHTIYHCSVAAAAKPGSK